MSENAYRASRLVRIRPDVARSDPAHVLDHPVTKSTLKVSNPGLVDALSATQQWTDRSTVVDRFVEETGIPTEQANTLFETLVDHGVVISRDSRLAWLESQAADWAEDGWAKALRYHLTVRDYPFLDLSNFDTAVEEDQTKMAEYREEEPVPPIYKRYPDAETIELPSTTDVDVDRSIDDVLAATTTSLLDPTRVPDEVTPIDREELATLLYLTFGEVGTQEFPEQGTFLLKTSPSGGSRHPVEAYVAVTDAVDLPDGVYHYSVEDHALERLPWADVDPILDAASGEQDADPACAVVCTAVIERCMWRYREPRSYRVIHQDVGHLLQTFRLVATSQDLEPTFRLVTDERPLERTLDLEPLDEPVVGVGGLW